MSILNLLQDSYQIQALNLLCESILNSKLKGLVCRDKLGLAIFSFRFKWIEKCVSTAQLYMTHLLELLQHFVQPLADHCVEHNGLPEEMNRRQPLLPKEHRTISLHDG